MLSSSWVRQFKSQPTVVELRSHSTRKIYRTIRTYFHAPVFLRFRELTKIAKLKTREFRTSRISHAQSFIPSKYIYRIKQLHKIISLTRHDRGVYLSWKFHIFGFQGSSIPRRWNLKTQLYFYGLAYHQHLSITKAEAFRKALRPEEFKLRRRFCVSMRADGDGFAAFSKITLSNRPALVRESSLRSVELVRSVKFLMVRKEEFTVCKLHVIIDTEYFST